MELTKGHDKSLKNYVDRFKTFLVRIENPDQYLVLMAFNKKLLADSTVINSPAYSCLVLDSFKQ